jgi:hypothetical protein
VPESLELDDYDIGILTFLSDTPGSTTSEIGNALWIVPFNLRKVDTFIRYRLQRLEAEGVVTHAIKARKKRYTVDPGKVLFGDGVLKMDGLGQVSIGYFIVVKKKNETIAKSLDDYEKRVKNFS